MAGRAAPGRSAVLLDGPWAHRTVRGNGIAMHVAEVGSGPLVVLVHGFPQFWWTWRAQLVALAAAGFRAVAVDLRGYGASDKPPRGYDAMTLSDDLAGLVMALGEADAVMVGDDLGGDLAWTMAARHPAIVRAAVILGSAHPLRMRESLRGRAQRQASAHVLRTFQIPRRPERLLTRDSAWVRGLFDRWSGPGWRAADTYAADVERYAQAMRIHPVAFCAAEHYRWIVRSVPRTDGQRFLAATRRPITAPVLHLHGALDTCVLPGTADGSGTHVTGTYEWRLLGGVGHYPQEEAPGLVSEAIVGWARRFS